MKNKVLIIIIGVVSILLFILLGIKYNISGNVGKLKSDINYPTSDGLAFSCDTTTINVGEEATCTLVGKYTNGIIGVSGELTFGDKIEKVSITYDEEKWQKFSTENEIEYVTYNGSATSDEFIIAEVKIRGIEVGSSNLTFTKSVGDKIEITLPEEDSLPVYLDDIVQEITVTNGLSSGGEEEEELSSVKTLESLTVSSGTLSPQFNKSITQYSVVVPNSVSQITINGTATDSNATVNGFDTYDINVGETQIQLEVVAQDFTSEKYYITVTREDVINPDKSSDNTLKSLTVQDVTLSPTFNPSIINYNATVENNITKLLISTEVNQQGASVTVDGDDNLKEGDNVININVKAEDNSVKTYTIVVTRKPSKSETCILQLSSAAYKVDNTKLVIDGVNKDDTDETIKNNLSILCGTITVSNDKVVISNGTDIKSYTINRVFVPNTGQNPVKYVAIIIGIVLIIGILIFTKKKMDK